MPPYCTATVTPWPELTKGELQCLVLLLRPNPVIFTLEDRGKTAENLAPVKHRF